MNIWNLKALVRIKVNHFCGAPYWPFVVLRCWEDACFDELVQQQAHVLPGDGAALQRGLQSVSYEHKQQLSAVHLLHTLQSLLLGQRSTKCWFQVWMVLYGFCVENNCACRVVTSNDRGLALWIRVERFLLLCTNGVPLTLKLGLLLWSPSRTEHCALLSVRLCVCVPSCRWCGDTPRW